jgi:hypothetical protein
MNKAEKAAAIAAITQLFKFYGTPSKWCPLVAVAIGAALEYADQPNAHGLISGVLLGAVVTGSFGMIKGAAQMTVAKPEIPSSLSSLEPDDDRGV